MKKQWYIGVVTVILLTAILTGCGKKIKLMDYYDATITGIDGKGKAKLSVDSAALEKDIMEAGKIDMNSFASLMELGQYMDGISFTMEPRENLKNGDTVILTVDYSGSKKNKVKLIGGEKKIKVNGLEKGQVINLFDQIQVEFSGVAPNAKAEIINNSSDSFVRNVNFSVSPSSGLRPGDKVVVTANYNEQEAIDNKYLVEVDTMEYTVENVDHYITAYGDLDTDTIQQMKKEAQDILDSYIVKNKSSILYDLTGTFWGNENGFKASTNLLKGVFFNLKNPDAVGSYGVNANTIALFYKIDVTTDEHKETKPVYAVIYFSNTIKRNDGKMDMRFSDGRVIRTELRMDDMDREIITANKDKYTIEEIVFD